MTEDAGIGSRIRRLRVARGLSQTDLAGTGVSASYVSLIESGRRKPTMRALTALAARLDTTVEYLRDGTSPAVAEQHRLCLDWAELALGNGAPREALDRAADVLAVADADETARWRAGWLASQAEEALGNLENAIRAFEALRAQAEQDPGRWPWLSVVVALCRCYREAGDIAYSISLAEAALARVSDLGLEGCDEHAEAAATLVGSYYERGDLAKARHVAEDLLKRTEQGSPRAQAAAYWNASVVAQEQGRVGDALHLAGRALARLSEAGTARSLARCRLAYAALLLRQEPTDPLAALEVLRASRHALEEHGSQVDLAYADTESARAHLQLGAVDDAIALAEAALGRLGDQPRLQTARALAVLGQALRAGGDSRAAAGRLRHAAQLLDHAQAGRDAAPVWHELADVLLQFGEHEEAIRAYQRSLAAAGVQPADIRLRR
jgi:transcriptional regulator with XRE-family HTH domain